jgi:hypothetical protein
VGSAVGHPQGLGTKERRIQSGTGHDGVGRGQDGVGSDVVIVGQPLYLGVEEA